MLLQFTSVVVAKPFDVFVWSICFLKILISRFAEHCFLRILKRAYRTFFKVNYAHVTTLLKRACLILLKGGFSFVLSINFVEQVCTPVNQACNLIEASYLSGGVRSLTCVHQAATTMSSITTLSKIHFPHNLRKRLKF